MLVGKLSYKIFHRRRDPTPSISPLQVVYNPPKTVTSVPPMSLKMTNLVVKKLVRDTKIMVLHCSLWGVLQAVTLDLSGLKEIKAIDIKCRFRALIKGINTQITRSWKI